VLEVSPDSVIEVDCQMDGEKSYFCRFFVHLDGEKRLIVTKDLSVCELADKLSEKIIELFHHRRRIGHMFEGEILPPVLRVLKA
jgi:hypothetical protein